MRAKLKVTLVLLIKHLTKGMFPEIFPTKYKLVV